MQIAPTIFATIAEPFVLENKGDGDAAVSDSCGAVLREIVRRSWRSGMFLTLLEDDARREDASLIGDCFARLVDDLVAKELEEGKNLDIIRGIISDLLMACRHYRFIADIQVGVDAKAERAFCWHLENPSSNLRCTKEAMVGRCSAGSVPA